MNISIKLHKKLQNEKQQLSNIYKIEKNKDGLKVVYKNNRAVHSKYNIENECKKALSNINNNKNLLIIYGYGLGYILKYLLENIDNYFTKNTINDLKIIVVIEDTSLFNYSYYNIYSTDNKNVFFILNEDIDYTKQIIDYKNINGTNFIMLPSLTKEEKDEAKLFYHKILDNIEKEISNIFTNMYFENIWTKNIILNSKYILQSTDINIFKNAFRGLKALLICPGPTLEYSLSIIKNNRESFIIICVDTSYSVLCKNDIIPDFIITVDGGFFNALDFIYEDKKIPYLVMDIACSKIIPKKMNNKANLITFTSNKNLPLIEYLNQYTPISPLTTSSTVATTMIDFAYYTGFSEILLIGFDNSYPFYQRHIKHTLSYEYMINKINKLNTMESYYFNTIKTTSNINTYPPTEFIFKTQVEYFESLKDNYTAMNIKRLTYDAIKIESIKEGNINDFKDDRNKALNIAQQLYKKPYLDNSIKTAYEKLKYILEDFKEIISSIYKNINNINDEKEINNLYLDTINLIKNYQEKASILKTILSTTIIISNRGNNISAKNKLIFLLSETISNTNYFLTRINMLINML